MIVTQCTVRGFDNNFSYLVHDGKHKDFAIVDPAGDVASHVRKAVEQGMRPAMILVTHSHLDHIEKIPQLLGNYYIPVYVHKNAQKRLTVPEELMHYVEEGDTIPIGSLKLSVMHTPGHIDDAVCFHITKENAQDGVPKLITGDTLFVEGCGRADLAHSSVESLYESLERIKGLEDNTEIHPGHDYGSKPTSNIAWEKEHNKYFLCKNLAEFTQLRLPKS